MLLKKYSDFVWEKKINLIQSFCHITVWETTARQLAKGEWKFRVASKIHFILAGLASNSRKASRNLKTLATITGYSFKIS